MKEMKTYQSRMPATRENVAYKLPEIDFTPQKRGEVLPEPERKRSGRTAQKSAVKPLHIAVLLVFAGFMAAVVTNYMSLNELSVTASRLESAIGKLEKEETALSAVQDKRMSIDEIEEYAVTRLGMVKQSGSTVEYINTGTEDKTTVLSGQTGAGGISRTLMAIFGQISSSLEFFR